MTCLGTLHSLSREITITTMEMWKNGLIFTPAKKSKYSTTSWFFSSVIGKKLYFKVSWKRIISVIQCFTGFAWLEWMISPVESLGSSVIDVILGILNLKFKYLGFILLKSYFSYFSRVKMIEEFVFFTTREPRETRNMFFESFIKKECVDTIYVKIGISKKNFEFRLRGSISETALSKS